MEINRGYKLLKKSSELCCTPFLFLLLFEYCLFDVLCISLPPLPFCFNWDLVIGWKFHQHDSSLCCKWLWTGITLWDLLPPPFFFSKCFIVARACNNKLGRKLELIIWFWMHKPCQISPQAWNSRSSCDTSKLNPGGSWPEVMKCVFTILMLSVLRHTGFTT